MAIDFPSTPFIGQQVTEGGTTWQWDGIGWNIVPVLYSALASDTPPANPADNQQWWRSTNGQMYLWYNDGNSKQWVQSAGSAGMPGLWEPIEYVQFTGLQYIKRDLTAWEKIRLTWDVVAAGVTVLAAQFSLDNGATWISAASSYYYQLDYGVGTTPQATTAASANIALSVGNNVGAPASGGCSGEMVMNRWNKPGWTSGKVEGAMQNQPTGNIITYNMAAGVAGNAACNALLVAATTPVSGTFMLEGVRG